MLVLPIITPLLRSGDSFAEILMHSFPLENEDIVCVSSKAVATAEGTARSMQDIRVTERAREIAMRYSMRDAAHVQAILDEMDRQHGHLLDSCPGVLLTALRPDGLPRGVILAPNAGLDRSNTDNDTVICWPRDPAASARDLRKAIERQSGKRVAVIITDSCCHPGRLGVTAFALAASGIDPTRSLVGAPDLFGHALRMTHEATADQLATAANAVMGNDAQSAPAAVIRGHGLALSDFEGWVPGIEPEEDLFRMR